MPSSLDLIPMEHIQTHILVLRGHRVAIDRDLAQLYGGVATNRLNEQVKRNGQCFFDHFVFQLAAKEKNAINYEIARKLGNIVVRAFIQLSQMMVNHKALTAKLAELDARMGEYGEQITSLVEAISNVTMLDGPIHKRKIGFLRTDD